MRIFPRNDDKKDVPGTKISLHDIVAEFTAADVDLPAFEKSIGMRGKLRDAEGKDLSKNGCPNRAVVGKGKPWEWNPQDLPALRTFFRWLLVEKTKKVTAEELEEN